MKKENKWEYDAIFDQPQDGLIEQQRITYKRRTDGKIEKTIVTRRFYGNSDYQDSVTTKIL